MKKRGWLMLALFHGCMVGPNYCPPEVAVADTWNAGSEEGDLMTFWWKGFQDDTLNALIEKTIQSNYTLAVAQAKILEARAIKQVVASKLYPHLAADMNSKKYYFSKNGFLSLFDKAGLPPVIPQIDNLFNFLFDVSWEIDLFGKNRRAVEAADAYIDSQIASKDFVLISLLSEVAMQYVDLRVLQQRVRLAKSNVNLASMDVEIAKQSVEYGLADQTDLEQKAQILANASAQVPNLESELLSAIYSLSVLIGEPPENLVEELTLEKRVPNIPEHISLGPRSDLVRRRPDIRRAERDLAAATATIGVAVASFFPSFSFGAQGGLQSLHWPSLFEWQSRTWNIGGDASLPIFQGGKIVGNLHLTQALALEAAKDYQQTILSALQEAESALAKFKSQLKTVKFLEESFANSMHIWSITKAQFHRGLVNRSKELASEKALVASEDAFLLGQKQALERLITLYKALGGGWEDKP